MASVSFIAWGPSETCNGDKSDLVSWIELKEPGVNGQQWENSLKEWC